ncbi:MAG: hypothetical protein OHK0028_17220 [Deltaproteobacteria bacterium]
MGRKIPLGVKLVGAFVVVSAICGFVAFVGIVKMHKVEDGGTFLYRDVSRPLVHIAEVSTHFHRMRGNTLQYMYAKTPEEEKEQRKRIEARRSDLSRNLDELGKEITTNEDRASFNGLKESLKSYTAAQEKIFRLLSGGRIADAEKVNAGETEKAREAVQAGIEKMFRDKEEQARRISEENTRTADASTVTMIAFMVAGIASSLGLGIFLSVSISRALARTSAALSEGASQVASASGQLSSSSQGLAEGSSEQAAALEETSSAMEEMSAMTKRNAESAGQAKSLADRAGTSVEKSNASMRSLVASMAEIAEMGEETGKIIKTIDEIAFQTNLLALNAAVEAARAGEAGAGFAVVADEVRNLAQRAAGAAKSTSDLIEGTIRKIQEGTVLVEKTNADFGEVSSAVSKVTELVGEISAASSEQSRGIDEVSRAIGQMDKVTQGNAANAEEVASASEELSAQAASMEEIVRNLEALVKGEGKGTVRSEATQVSSARRKPVMAARAVPPLPARTARASAGSGRSAGGNGSGRHSGGNGKFPPGMRPEDLIPLEEKAMAEF